MLTLRLAAAELRQQVRGPVFRIVAFVSLLMVVGAGAIDALRLDSVHGVADGPALIVRVHLVWTLFYLFTAAAFVGEAVTRDVQTGFAPLVRATPVPRPAYLFGRFAGATTAVLLCFLTVPVGLLAARLIPGANAEWVAPVAPASYVIAFFALAVPNLLLGCALFLLLATATRSMNGCLLGAVALLSLYALSDGQGGVTAILEPFGFGAAQALQAGDAGPLVANRALWLALAIGFVACALWLDARIPSGARRRRPRPAPARAARPRRSSAAAATRSSGAAAAISVVLARTRHHLREIVAAPVFRVLLLLGLGSCIASLWPAVQAQAPLPELLARLVGSFVLVPIVVVLFFAGEIHWSDAAHRMDRIVDATPAPRAALLVAQLLALGIILLLLALVTGLAVPALLLATGRAPGLGLLATAYILPKAYDWMLLGVLAWFLQVLSPGKLAGWGYFVLFLIATLALDQAGLTNPALHYGRYPGAPLPPELTGAPGANLYRAGWGLVAAALLGLAIGIRSERHLKTAPEPRSS